MPAYRDDSFYSALRHPESPSASLSEKPNEHGSTRKREGPRATDALRTDPNVIAIGSTTAVVVTNLVNDTWLARGVLVTETREDAEERRSDEECEDPESPIFVPTLVGVIPHGKTIATRPSQPRAKGD